MSAIGKSGARSAGPMGWPVPGWRTGGGATGRSAAMLYQARGMRSSASTNFVCLVMGCDLRAGGVGRRAWAS